MMYRRMGIIIIVLTLTACAQWQVVTEAWHSEACEDITDFYTAASSLSDETGKEMLQALRSNQAQGDNPCDQLRLVILLGKPGTVLHDDTEAAWLLRNFLHDPENAQHPDWGLALLLADNIKARQRLQEKLLSQEKNLVLEQAFSQKLAEELKQQHAATEALKSQLKQLKSIEQDINEKAQSAATSNGKRESR